MQEMKQCLIYEVNHTVMQMHKLAGGLDYS